MLVTPTLIINDLTQLEPEALWQQGLRGFIFDLDNTLMAPKTGVLSDAMQAWLAGIERAGFRSVVLSNNRRPQYIQQSEAVLGFKAIGHARKPRLKGFYEALEHLQLPPQQVAVVGDRPLTDIWGGERLGAYTILVDPLMKAYEPWFIQGLRWLERRFVNE